MRTIIYVDGYNFYSLLANPQYSKYKWLDLKKFFETLLPKHEIIKIKYFTAQMNYAPDRLERQQKYFGALRYLYPDTFDFVYGKFELDKNNFPREKQTDVNLACHMVHDAHTIQHDYSVIVTNDTDFVSAIKLVKVGIEFPKDIFCIPPVINNKGSKPLRRFKRPDIKITKDILNECQLDNIITGTFYERPKQW